MGMLTIESMNVAGEIWFEIVWPMAWQAALVGLVLLLFVRLGRRLSAPFRYGLLLVALLKFVTPPVTDLPFGLLSQIDVSANPVLTDVSSVVAPADDVSATDSDLQIATVTNSPVDSIEFGTNMRELLAEAQSNSGSLNQTVPSDNAIPVADVVATRATDVPSVQAEALTWKASFLMIHALGAIGFLVVVFRQLIRIHRQIRRAHQVSTGDVWNSARNIATQLGLRSPPRIVLCAAAAVPYSFGLFRRVVVIPAKLPEQLEAEHMEAVLFHELCHHRRFDLWVNSFQVFVSAFWWFNPLIWILCRDLRSTREDCCDDLVLSTNAVASVSYCETLVRVAAFCHGPVPLIAVTMADSRHPLAGRMKRVMDDNLPRRGRIGRVSALIVVVAASLLLPGLRAMKAEPQNDAVVEADNSAKHVVIHGVVADAAGQPTADVQVFIAIADRWSERLEVNEPIAPVRSAEDGSFRFSISPGQMNQFLANSSTHTRFVAIKKDHGLGLAEFRGPLPNATVKLTLASPATARIRVLKPDGRPCSGAEVKVATVRGNSTSRFEFSEALQSVLSERSDQNGEVQVSGIAPQNVIGVSVEADGFGTQLSSQYEAQKSIAEIRLRDVGRIDGQLALEGIRGADPTQVSLRLVTSSPDRLSQPQNQYGISTVTPDANGRFTVPQLASGDLRIFATYADHFAFRAVPPLELFLSASSDLKVSIPLQKGIPFTRLILDEKTKEPVVGARAHLQNGYQRMIVRSDVQGRFRSWLLPNVPYHTVYDLPPEYLSRNISADTNTRVSANGGDRKLSDVLVLKGRTVRGIVVDKDGTPQANLRVGADWVDPAEDFGERAVGAIPARAWGQTDDAGRFEIKAVHPDADVILTPARTGLRMAEPQRFTRDAPEPFRLTVNDFELISFAGNVVYRDGNPAKNVTCWLYAKADGKPGDRYGSLTHQIPTETDGTFTTPSDLPVNFAYRVWVRSGYKEIGSSDWFSAASLPGGTIPQITVSDEFRMPVESESPSNDIDLHIVDSAGTRVPGANVVVWYTAKRRRVPANDEGVVRLSSVPPTGFWAFAKADGFRFHGDYISDTTAARLILRRVDEDVPAMTPAPVTLVTEAVQTLARDKFMMFAEKVFSTDNDENKKSNLSPPHRKRDVHRTLATVDPDAAVALIGDERIDLSSIKFSNSTTSYQASHDRTVRSIAERVRAKKQANAIASTPEQQATKERQRLNAAVEGILDTDQTTKNAERLTSYAAQFLDLGDVDRAKRVFDRARDAQPTAGIRTPQLHEGLFCLAICPHRSSSVTTTDCG